MGEAPDESDPLNMYQLNEQGPYVLPPTLCSARRAEYFRRSNAIVGFYTVIVITSKQGSDVITQAEQQGKFEEDTPFRLIIAPDVVSQLSYGLFKTIIP